MLHEVTFCHVRTRLALAHALGGRVDRANRQIQKRFSYPLFDWLVPPVLNDLEAASSLEVLSHE